MRVFDPTINTIPSFRRRATMRLAELARLQAALSYTEAWDSPHVEEVLRDARRLRHGLRSLANSGSLSLDEQRFICERLLPILPEQSAATTPVVVPVAVTVALSQVSKFILGLSTVAHLRVVVGSNVPAGAKLVLLRDGQTVVTQTATAGAALLDVAAGEKYTAQLYYNNQLLGTSSLTLEQEYPVRWGVLPVGVSTITDQAIAGFGALPAVFARMPLPFTVPAGRGNLAIVLPPNYQWALKDPRLNTDLSASFQASNQVLNVVGVGQVPVVLLRQPTPVIGPFSFAAILELT